MAIRLVGPARRGGRRPKRDALRRHGRAALARRLDDYIGKFGSMEPQLAASVSGPGLARLGLVVAVELGDWGICALLLFWLWQHFEQPWLVGQPWRRSAPWWRPSVGKV